MGYQLEAAEQAMQATGERSVEEALDWIEQYGAGSCFPLECVFWGAFRIARSSAIHWIARSWAHSIARSGSRIPGSPFRVGV